jgi:glycosyltransferase involved in cell wall biosynthesis
MRVLCVTLNYADVWGGTTVSVGNFSHALDADILSFTFESLIPIARHGTRIIHIPVPDSLIGRLYSRPRAEHLRQATELARKYDVIVCHMLFRYHNAWVTGLGKPYCIVPHGSLDPYVFTYRRLQKELWLLTTGSRYFRSAESVVFATERERQKSFRGLGSDKANVINWGVNVSAGKSKGESRLSVRKQLGIAKNEKMLLSIGRLHSMKRLMEMIEAFAMASQKRLHLVIAGPEEQYSINELQVFATRCGALNIHIIGPVFGDEKWGLYRAADGYISVSKRENFGYSLAEAMTMGLPSILSSGNDLAYEFHDERCFWMLGADTKEDVARAIRTFACSKSSVLKHMGERGRRWVIKNATSDLFRTKIRKLVFSMNSKKRAC